MTRLPIIGEPNYSHAHYWRADTPKCGIATPSGSPCQLPREPGLPWCNPHVASYLASMKTAGYQMEHARVLFESQGWDAVTVTTALARFERLLAPQKPAEASEVPEATAAPERAAEGNVEPARKPRGL